MSAISFIFPNEVSHIDKMMKRKENVLLNNKHKNEFDKKYPSFISHEQTDPIHVKREPCREESQV